MKKILFRIFLIVLIFELFVFNFSSFRILSNKEKKEFTNKDFVHIETDDEDITFIQINNIKAEIKTVYLKLKNIDVVDYTFLYTDETTKDLATTPTKTYVENLENSKYIPCYLSGNSNSFGIKIYEENTQIELITINEKIPLNFNVLRFIILYLSILFVYLIKNDETFKIPFSEKNLKQELILLIIITLFLCITCYINDFSKQKGLFDSYSYDFIKAISQGKVSLDRQPSEKLISLKNPYDASERSSAGLVRGVDYIWDTAYYNEKYYVYFGILPALILMVPYHIITNKYMICATAVLIFSILTAISIKILIKNIFERFFKEVPFKFMVLSLLILLFGSQILVLNGIPRFYEVPIISGIFFAITGINFMFLAIKDEYVNYKNLFYSCLFLSLAVACRPTQLFVSLTILPVIFKIFINNLKNKENILKNILAVCIPYVVIGSLLMFYNYIRFGNIFEFGASYQLTINDMSNLSNRFMTIGIGLICNLFSIPNFVPNFPFIYNHNNLTTFYGYYYIENMVGGLFILVPICFSILGLYKVLKHSENREVVKFISIFTLIRTFNLHNKFNDGWKYAKIYGRLCLVTDCCRYLFFYRNI